MPQSIKAMILAAGRGERMRPLTDSTPKPLLEIGGKPLIVWHIEKLAQAGIHEIIINHAWLGEQIESALGDGDRWDVKLQYSREETALETAGGIAFARPLLEGGSFILVSADIFCDYDYSRLVRQAALVDADPDKLGHLVMVNNPSYHPNGDFSLVDGRIGNVYPRLCYANLAVIKLQLVDGLIAGSRAALGPLLHAAAGNGHLSGEFFSGRWINVGTPADLQEANESVQVG